MQRVYAESLELHFETYPGPSGNKIANGTVGLVHGTDKFHHAKVKATRRLSNGGSPVDVTSEVTTFESSDTGVILRSVCHR